MKKPEFSFVIPAHNEQDNIGRLIAAIIGLGRREGWKNYEILVVNDNSSDRTKKIVQALQKRHKFISRLDRAKGNNGMGYSLIEGTKKARGKIIIWTMGDLSDNINTYPKLLNAIENGCDMVFGSRYMKGGSRGNLSPFKAFLSSSFTRVTKLLYGIESHDITNAFRAFRKEVFENAKLESGDFAISPEFAIKAQKMGCKLGEVPTTYTDRQAGKSSFKIMKMGRRYATILLKLLFYRPQHVKT